MKKTLMIEGMSCGHCSGAVEKALKEISGVSSVTVDLAGKKAEVEGDNLSDDQLKAAVEDAGYDVTDVK